MRDGGRIAAAIEVLAEINERRRPVQEALKDWGNKHRFAGSGDRVAIGNLVFDALRHKLSHAQAMGSEDARALVLATYIWGWGNEVAQLEQVMELDHHAPEPLSDLERNALLENCQVEDVEYVSANVPEWLWSHFQDNFGDEAHAVGKSLSERAPIDMRVNTIKSTQEKVLKRLEHLKAEASGLSPVGVRLAPVVGSRKSPHVQAEETFRKGRFELQDEASQIASILSGAKPGEQVLDLCAGGGGKSLALAAQMENKGQIYAYDAHKTRLAPLYDRMARAGVRNIQTIDPQTGSLDVCFKKMDRVFVDAPCTGTGVWRRRPDTKWRVTESALSGRVEDQAQVLESAVRFVRSGGKLIYATCSLIPAENQLQIKAFLEKNSDFKIVDLEPVWEENFGAVAGRKPLFKDGGTITLTPYHTDTDGFFIAMMERD
ncbi:RsmB/NOP family class I SAM-dependent RNA methyltransferase [Pseudovibrio sp. Tun.PSC04-5.I4]|uniref:RsmB/NOP family class I SAM-dependent RNA methyltransferase n=1 Tax=Pseudovibrio sp. Tun.PSC04-5.I4 TaxID=1798213 RepID=UPI00088143B4|nr:RsmB/NOP family class I SAM-dependent RNA methyltransferase [Pseudovibrio sp. Tun.PSC04-5.I4]SDQ94510.1 16S rRNA (cytosine967-C5)-methyltransferase [Pseudovibrio sp. Tun.PSC04-5.I4]